MQFELAFNPEITVPDAVRNKEPFETVKELLFLYKIFTLDHCAEPEKLGYYTRYEDIHYAPKKHLSYNEVIGELKDLAGSLRDKGQKPVKIDAVAAKGIVAPGSIDSTITYFTEVSVTEDKKVYYELSPKFKQILVKAPTTKLVTRTDWAILYRLNEFSCIRTYLEIKHKIKAGEEIVFDVSYLHQLMRVSISYKKSFKEFNRQYLKTIDKRLSKELPGYKRENLKTGRKVTHIKFFVNEEALLSGELASIDDPEVSMMVSSLSEPKFVEYLRNFRLPGDFTEEIRSGIREGKLELLDIENNIMAAIEYVIKKNNLKSADTLLSHDCAGAIRKAIEQNWRTQARLPELGDLDGYLKVKAKRTSSNPQKLKMNVSTVKEANVVEPEVVYSREMIESIALSSVDISQRPKVQELLDSDYRASIEAAVRSWFLPDGKLKPAGLGSPEGDLMLRKMLLKKIGASVK